MNRDGGSREPLLHNALTTGISAVPGIDPSWFSQPTSRSRLPIGVVSVGDANDQNDERVVPDFVHDAVVSHPEPLQSPKVALQRRAEIGGLGQAVHGDGKIVEVFEVVLDGEADNIRLAAP